MAGWINSFDVGDSIVLAKHHALFGVKDNNLIKHVIIVCKDTISKSDVLDLNRVITRVKMEKETDECIAMRSGMIGLRNAVRSGVLFA